MKTWLLTLLVVLFGMGQAACACPVVAEIPVQVAAVEQVPDAGTGHDCHPEGTALKAEQPSKPDPSDCDHCKSASAAVFMAAADLVPAQFAATPVDSILVMADAPRTVPETSPLERQLRLWTGPPDGSLVSLKVKFLN